MQPDNKPIGYWVKQVDEVLTQGINNIHMAFGITRTDWQVLHTIHEHGSISSSKLTDLLKPFADAQALEKIIVTFRERELLHTGDEAALSLSEKGRQLHAGCFEKQQAFRKKAMSGIAEQEYVTAISVLQKIVENGGM